jgi:hypothetical protein
MLHAFGPGDDHVGGGNASVSTPPTVSTSQAACQSTSTAEGLPPRPVCVQIGTSGRWRNDDGQPSTIEDRQLDSDWRTLLGRAVNNRLTACISNGQCH